MALLDRISVFAQEASPAGEDQVDKKKTSAGRDTAGPSTNLRGLEDFEKTLTDRFPGQAFAEPLMTVKEAAAFTRLSRHSTSVQGR